MKSIVIDDERCAKRRRMNVRLFVISCHKDALKLSAILIIFNVPKMHQMLFPYKSSNHNFLGVVKTPSITGENFSLISLVKTLLKCAALITKLCMATLLGKLLVRSIKLIANVLKLSAEREISRVAISITQKVPLTVVRSRGKRSMKKALPPFPRKLLNGSLKHNFQGNVRWKNETKKTFVRTHNDIFQHKQAANRIFNQHAIYNEVHTTFDLDSFMDLPMSIKN